MTVTYYSPVAMTVLLKCGILELMVIPLYLFLLMVLELHLLFLVLLVTISFFQALLMIKLDYGTSEIVYSLYTP